MYRFDPTGRVELGDVVGVRGDNHGLVDVAERCGEALTRFPWAQPGAAKITTRSLSWGGGGCGEMSTRRPYRNGGTSAETA